MWKKQDSLFLRAKFMFWTRLRLFLHLLLNIKYITITSIWGYWEIQTAKNVNRTVWTITRAFTTLWLFSSEACVKWQNLAIWVSKKTRKENSMKLLKFTVQLLSWQFGIIVRTECVWLEVTTGTLLSATELTQALFTLQKLLFKERYD